MKNFLPFLLALCLSLSAYADDNPRDHAYQSTSAFIGSGASVFATNPIFPANGYFNSGVGIGTTTTNGYFLNLNAGTNVGEVITSTNANAFAVGQNGGTNPAFQVNSTIASSVNGWSVASTSTGNAARLGVLSSATNESGYLVSKGNAFIMARNSSATADNSQPVFVLHNVDTTSGDSVPMSFWHNGVNVGFLTAISEGTNTQTGHFALTVGNNGAFTNAITTDHSGNVTIGSSSVPASALDVYGAISINGTNAIFEPEPQTIAIGSGALNSWSPIGTGQMVLVGYQAGYNSTTVAQNNVFLGWKAGYGNTSGFLNDAMGHDALGCNQKGTNNTALGEGAMYGLTISSGSSCTNYSSNYNTSVGASSLLYYKGSSGYNTAVGQIALGSDTTGDANTCVGQNCLGSQTTAGYNVAFGGNAGDNLTTGGNNLMLGFNTQAIGTSASNTMNIDGIIYGSGVGYPNAANSGTIGIGSATVSSSNKLEVNGAVSIGYPNTYGGTAGGLIVSGSVGIGTTTPGQKLEIYDSSATYPQMQILETGSAPAWLYMQSPSGQQASLQLYSGSTSVWDVGKDGSNNFLVYDNVNSKNIFYAKQNVGASINTTTVSSAFNVNGGVSVGSTYVNTVAPTNGIIVQGNVGIGTTSPNELLDVWGTLDIDSSSASAFTVGQNGNANPALQINASNASSVTGWNITSTASGSSSRLNVISSATNENGYIVAKGTGFIMARNSYAGSDNGGPQLVLHNTDTTSGDSVVESFWHNGVNIAFLSALSEGTNTQTGHVNITVGNAGTFTTGISIDHSGQVGIGTSIPAGSSSTFGSLLNVGSTGQLSVNSSGALTTSSTIKTGGYTVGTLPAGTVGMRAYVTDQLTTCATVGAVLTGGGSAVCPVFYNGSAWVGG